MEGVGRVGGGVVLGKVSAEDIESGEHPAAAGALLVVDALLRSLDGEGRRHRSGIAVVLGQIIDLVLCDGIGKSAVSGRGRLAADDLTELDFRESASWCRLLCRQRGSGKEE